MGHVRANSVVVIRRRTNSISKMPNTKVEMKDLTKFGSAATARGRELKFEETSSPVDPGDKGKVAEAIDVCFPEEVRVRRTVAM